MSYKNRVQKLLESYENFISLPWNREIASEQRVIFCVYKSEDELRIRLHLKEFQIATERSKRRWVSLDLTDSFSDWMAGWRYAKQYFKSPEKLVEKPEGYFEYLEKVFDKLVEEEKPDENTVACVYGVGSLFGFVSVSELFQKYAKKHPGRLVVLFPGHFENNVYRLLDAYDGWNYHATPITSEKKF